MSKCKVTIEILGTYTCEVDDARDKNDAFAQALRDHYLWTTDSDCNEIRMTAEQVSE